LVAWSTLTHHPSLAAFTGSFTLVFHHDSSIHHGFQVIVWDGYQIGLQLLLKSIQEALSLLLMSVDVVRGVPSPGSELVEVLGDTHPTLLEVEELVTQDLDESGGNVGFAKHGLEASQVITCPSGCMARLFSHHAPAAPARK
jgi:hypothetical protein